MIYLISLTWDLRQLSWKEFIADANLLSTMKPDFSLKFVFLQEVHEGYLTVKRVALPS